MRRRYRHVTAALAVTGVASFGLTGWAAQKMYSIGVQASDTGTSGGGDPILWLWLFLGLFGLASSIAGLCVLHWRSTA
jgi:hypothetical protein